MTERKAAAVAFCITSPLKVAQTLLESEPTPEIEADIARMVAEGRIAWEITGTRLTHLSAVDGHRVATLTEELVRRFCLEKESFFGFDVNRVSSNLCRSVALVHTVITHIEGGVYNPEELLCMPFTDLEDLWFALLSEAREAAEGKRMAGTTGV